MKKIFSLSVLAFSLLGIISNQAYAVNWRNLGKSEAGEFFFDTDSLRGPQEDKKINIKLNVNGQTPDGTKSRLLSYSVNCNDSSLLMEALKYYDAADLSGSERIINVQAHKRFEAKPQSMSKQYVDAACGKLNSADASKAPPPSPEDAASNAKADDQMSTWGFTSTSLGEQYKIVEPRKPEYLITKMDKRPDGTVDLIEAVDLNSAVPDWNAPFNHWFVISRTGKPANESQGGKLTKSMIDPMPAKRLSYNCQEQYAPICKRGREIYFEKLALSNDPEDYKDTVDPSLAPNFLRLPASSRISSIMREWTRDENFSNGLHYDITAFLDLTRSFWAGNSGIWGFDGYRMNGMERERIVTRGGKEKGEIFKAKWRTVRDQFGALMTRIAISSGVPTAAVYEYFGFNEQVFWNPHSEPINSNNPQYSKKARENFKEYAGVFNGQVPDKVEWPPHLKGFPYTYTLDQLLQDYFPGQFKKYISRSSELATIRVKEESNLAAIKERQRKADEFAASPEGIKQAQQREAEQKRKEQEAEAALAKEYPYFAVISCGFTNQHINILSCFGGRVGSEIELRNGGAYGLYKINQIYNLGKESREGFVIDLKSNFAIKAQNSSDTLILGMKIYRRTDKSLLYNKQGAQWGTLMYKN